MDVLAVYDHRLSCWKTCQLSLFEEESTWSERLPNWGMIANGVLYQLVDPRDSERHTFGNGGSSLATLPTPRAGHHHIENEELRKKRKEKHGNVPQSLGNSIVEQIRMGMLPTPTANDSKNGFTPSQIEGRVDNMHKAISEGRAGDITIGKDSRLNPRFVEEMMGFPIGWTDLEL